MPPNGDDDLDPRLRDAIRLIKHIPCFQTDGASLCNSGPVLYYSALLFIIDTLQLGQLRLNPPGLGSKCGKWVERFSDFGKYKGYIRNH